MRDLSYRAELAASHKKTAKPLLWLAMTSMSMLFAGLTSAYLVRADNGNWLLFKLPGIFFISTALIITSSYTMLRAVQKARANNFAGITWHLLFTLLLGIAFTFCQFESWSQLTADGIVFGGKYSNASGSFLYALTGMHLLHLAGGLIALLVTSIKSKRRVYNSGHMLGIELCSIYWHFLTGVWVYLFVFLFFVR